MAINPMAQRVLQATKRPPRVKYDWDMDYKKRPGFAEGRRQYGRGAAQTLGGLAGLFLGPGSRDRAAGDLMRLYPPIEKVMDLFGYSPYGGASKRLRRAAQLGYGGKMPGGYYDALHRQLLRGPFESKRGVLSRAAGGMKFPDRVKVYQQAMANGLLEKIHPGMSPAAQRRAVNSNMATTSQLNKAVSTLREEGGGSISNIMRRIKGSGLLNKYPAHYLPTMLRQRQIPQMLRS